MQELTITLYNFDELNDDAKEKARKWWRDGLDYPWWEESLGSIRAFVEHFGAKVLDYSLGDGSGRDYIRTNLDGHNLRGLKLTHVNKNYMPTGYYLDATLWGDFYKEFKRSGDAKYAFDQALEAAISDINRNIEYQSSDECVDECLAINGYQFTAEGKVWR